MTWTRSFVLLAGTAIETTVTDEAAAVDGWVDTVLHIYGRERIFVGLDCEWKPNRSPFENNKAATLQLCVDTKCLIIQLFYLNRIPQRLSYFLGFCPNVFLVGVEVGGDITKLHTDYGLACTTQVMDVQSVATLLWPNVYYPGNKPGLKRLAYDVVGMRVDKPAHVRCSNWEARVLSLEQVRYACIDAYASCMIGKRLLNVA